MSLKPTTRYLIKMAKQRRVFAKKNGVARAKDVGLPKTASRHEARYRKANADNIRALRKRVGGRTATAQLAAHFHGNASRLGK